MLAPGEYLIKPPPPESVPAQPGMSGNDSAPASTPPVKAGEEQPTFLIILLRALGAIHS